MPSYRGLRILKVFISSKGITLTLIADFNVSAKDLPAIIAARSISVIRNREPCEREFIRFLHTDLKNH